MIRTFKTNLIRNVDELSGSGWTFRPLCDEYAGKTFDVVVPCCWETIPEFCAYRGKGVFHKLIQTREGNLRIKFEGISHTGRIFLDGKFLGQHYNAYTPFEIIVRNVSAGQHTLDVEVDNSFSEESALHIPNDYMTYGGITRGVAMEQLGDVYIQLLQGVPYKEDNGWGLKVKVTVENLSENSQKIGLMLNLQELGVETALHSIELKSRETTEVVENLFFKDEQPVEWMPEHPRLYQIQARIWQEDKEKPIDDLIERIGFREIRIKGQQILLNGKAIRIKGFCRHEDHPSFGCALPLQIMQQDIQIMKDLGANAVRTSHYPNDQLFLDLCDEEGLLVWEENHARGLTEEMMRNPHFEDQAEACIREMIPAHINHPSIIIWGILNECASETEYGYSCYSKQYSLIRSLDRSRPTSSASCKFKTDICFGLPDIVSYNIYPEWYVDEPAADYLKSLYDWVQTETEGAGKPFLITETGAGAIYGYRTPTLDKWSEEYQAKALEDQITAVMEQRGCSGIFIWQFCDVRISKEWFATRPRTMNNKGVVDEYRRQKLSYDVVKRLYHSYSDYL